MTLKSLKYIALLLLMTCFVPVKATNAKDIGSFVAAKISDADRRKFDYFFYEGLNLKNAGKFDAAYDAFYHCLELDSTAAPVLYELSSFYVQLDRPNKAVEMLKRAVANSTDNMYGEAAEEYEELIKEYPDKAELYYYLADAYTQSGDIGKAIDAYDSLESIIGMNEALSMQKYKLYNQLEKQDEAYWETSIWRRKKWRKPWLITKRHTK